jgi:hypothetical protein
MEIDLISAVGHLFHHNPTYSDLDIAWWITEDYNLEHLTLTARFVKRIRPEQGRLRRHNDPATAEMLCPGSYTLSDRSTLSSSGLLSLSGQERQS